MPNRGIATTSFALAVCFLLLSHFDGYFFLIHFYESLIYLAIVLMLFYFEDRWAYMIGMLAPAVWMALNLAWGGLHGIAVQATAALHPHHPFFAVGILSVLATAFSLLLIGKCAYRWQREFRGLGKGWSTLVISSGVVVLYYALIVIWILRWPRLAA
ncbi:MAG TPA: hypothetical protein VJR23_00200 [Candidatus Acidoferrales bacterium]|nr:hypothetical protein [Candidatus Acidoferrales bacterium]